MNSQKAAEVLVIDDSTNDDLLWMGERELWLNISEFGPHPELLKAQKHYRTKERFPK